MAERRHHRRSARRPAIPLSLLSLRPPPPPAPTQRAGLLQHTLKAAAYDALAAFPLRLMPERNAFVVAATQACFGVCNCVEGER